jgi:hypothetical protein
MAPRRAQGILVNEMDPGAYIERLSFFCSLRGRRCAIERLGVGWPSLSFLPINLPTKAALPGLRPDPRRAEGRG